MLLKIRYFIREAIKKFGYQLVPHVKMPLEEVFPKDMEKEFQNIYQRCSAYTMTSRERMYALYQAVRYVLLAQIPGDLVECGIWKGGSSMLMAETLISLHDTNRKIYLYDTYAGMPEPTEKDKLLMNGRPARDEWQLLQKKDHNEFCYASLEEVKKNLALTSYPQNNLLFVQGKVEDTIPNIIPRQISLLRLDTDWFASTQHELRHLFPLLENRGVIIIDDYGCWAGAKEGVDQYFQEKGIPILLHRIDYTGRIGIKYSS